MQLLRFLSLGLASSLLLACTSWTHLMAACHSGDTAQDDGGTRMALEGGKRAGALTLDDWFTKGNAALEDGRCDDAVLAFNECIKREPNDADALYGRGRALDEMGRYRSAIADFTKAIEFVPTDADAYCGRGRALDELGRHRMAIADFTKAIGCDPNDAAAYCGRGRALDELGRHRLAIADFTMAIGIDPNDVDAYCDRGYALDELGGYSEAIADFSTAIELDPKDAEAYDGRGAILDGLGRHQEAIADFTKAIGFDPHDADAYCGRGVVMEELDRYREAAADYAKAIAVDPKNLPARLNLAEALLCDGKAEQCLTELRKAEVYVKEDENRLNVSYLRLLATKTLGRETARIEAEFAAWLDKDVEVTWDTAEIERWLASGKVDPQVKAFAIGITDRLKAKKHKVDSPPQSGGEYSI